MADAAGEQLEALREELNLLRARLSAQDTRSTMFEAGAYTYPHFGTRTCLGIRWVPWVVVRGKSG